MTFDFMPLALGAAERSRSAPGDFTIAFDKAIPRPVKVLSAAVVLAVFVLALVSLALAAPALARQLPPYLAQVAKDHDTNLPAGATP